MKRVNNPSKYLKGIIDPGTHYYIGFGIKELTSVGQANRGIQDLIAGNISSVIVTGRKGPLRENTEGKYVRKKPEVKTSVWKHIEYYSTKWSKMISYDREYFVYEKELLHKFNLPLRKVLTPQKEWILVFPTFIMQDNQAHYLLAGAAMNIACALSGYLMTYDVNFEPIVATKFVDKSLLPAGILDRPVAEKLETIQENIHLEDEAESGGNSERFAVLKEKQPDDVTIGHGGFGGYLMFEFIDEDLLVFENLNSGNATYVFKRSEFNPSLDFNKQKAMQDKAFLKRIVHENIPYWKSQLGRFLG